MNYTESDLLKRRFLPKTEEEQKEAFNGWCFKKIGTINCITNDDAYIPITCAPAETLSNINDPKARCDRKKCKLLLCKRVHDVEELKSAISINNCIKSTVIATDEAFKDDLFCRVIMKNMGKINGKEVHDFVGILENIAGVEAKYLLDWAQIEKIFKLKTQ
jgi:hypothetical protein